MNTKRLAYLDYAKAFAILVPVFAHIGFSEIGNLALFCIPVFWVVAGYTYVPGRRSLKESIAAKFKAILLPFWGFMFLYIIVELIRAPYVGYADSRFAILGLLNTVYGSGCIPNRSGLLDGILPFKNYMVQSNLFIDIITPTNNPLWFLPAFFIASILFCCIIEKTKKKHWSRLPILVALILLTSLEVVIPGLKQLPYGLGRGFLGAAFMMIGFWMKQYDFFNKRKSVILPAVAVSFFIAISSILLGFNGRGMVSSNYGSYQIFGIFMTFVGGVGAACFLLYVCMLIEKLPFSRIKNALSLVGKNTFVIYVWHMLFKFIFDVIYLEAFNSPVSRDKYYMVLLPSSAWWYMILEVVAIVFVCVLMGEFKTKIKFNFNRKLQPK